MEHFLVRSASYAADGGGILAHHGGNVPAHTIVVGNPILTAGSLAANYAADKYVESRINENTRFDMVVFTDAKGKKYIYHVHRKDLDYFFGVLGQIAPHIRFVQG